MNIIDVRNYIKYIVFFIESRFTSYNTRFWTQWIHWFQQSTLDRKKKNFSFSRKFPFMKSKDDKSEDGSDQERECLNCFPLSRLLHVLCMFSGPYLLCLRVLSRRMYPPILIYRIYIMRFWTAELWGCSSFPNLPVFYNRWIEFLLMIHVLYEIEFSKVVTQDIISEKSISLSFVL